MTPEAKIAKREIIKLLKRINKKFSTGCHDIECTDCPLYDSEYWTTEGRLCDLLVYKDDNIENTLIPEQ